MKDPNAAFLAGLVVALILNLIGIGLSFLLYGENGEYAVYPASLLIVAVVVTTFTYVRAKRQMAASG